MTNHSKYCPSCGMVLPVKCFGLTNRRYGSRYSKCSVCRLEAKARREVASAERHQFAATMLAIRWKEEVT